MLGRFINHIGYSTECPTILKILQISSFRENSTLSLSMASLIYRNGIRSLVPPSRSFTSFASQSSASATAPQEFKLSRTFNNSQKQLYQVIADVESYPTFLPFCTGAKLLETDDTQHLKGGKEGDVVKLLAELGAGFPGMETKYKSLVECTKWSKVTARAGDHDVFNHLETNWTLTPTTHSTPENPSTTVTLSITYSLSNPLHQAFLSMTFPKFTSKILTAFESRIRSVPSIP